MNSVRKGRPRDRRLDDQITETALELLGDVGFERFSVEEVAVRAGVAKTTVYRRFPTRNELVAAALERLNDNLALPPDDWSVRDRLVEVLTSLRQRKSDASSPDRLLYVATANCRDPELQTLVRTRVIEPRRSGLRSILTAGIASGELRADLDPEAAIAVLVGSMQFLGAADQRGEPSAASAADVVDCALRGLGAPALTAAAT